MKKLDQENNIDVILIVRQLTPLFYYSIFYRVNVYALIVRKSINVYALIALESIRIETLSCLCILIALKVAQPAWVIKK